MECLYWAVSNAEEAYVMCRRMFLSRIAYSVLPAKRWKSPSVPGILSLFCAFNEHSCNQSPTDKIPFICVKCILWVFGYCLKKSKIKKGSTIIFQ